MSEPRVSDEQVADAVEMFGSESLFGRMAQDLRDARAALFAIQAELAKLVSDHKRGRVDDLVMAEEIDLLVRANRGEG